MLKYTSTFLKNYYGINETDEEEKTRHIPWHKDTLFATVL